MVVIAMQAINELLLEIILIRIPVIFTKFFDWMQVFR
jgi:hypothetical protein